MGSAAVSHAEVACGQMQGITGENVSRPRSRAARQDDGVNPLVAIKSHLRANERSVGGSAVRIVAAGHVYFDIAESVLRKMSFQRGESFIGFHVRHETQIELGNGAMRKNRLPAWAGVAADQPLDVHRGPRLKQFERLLVIHVVYPMLHAELFLGDVFVETARGFGDHLLLFG